MTTVPRLRALSLFLVRYGICYFITIEVILSEKYRLLVVFLSEY